MEEKEEAEEEEGRGVSGAPMEPLVSPTLLLKGKRKGEGVGIRSGRSRSRGPASARKRK